MFTSTVVSGNTAKQPVANHSAKEILRKRLVENAVRRPQSAIIHRNNGKCNELRSRFQEKRASSLDSSKYHDINTSRKQKKKNSTGIKKIEKNEKKSGFIKNIFQHNTKSNESNMNKALWSVLNITDGITQNLKKKPLEGVESEDIDEEELLQEIPTILINGIPFDKIEAEQSNKRDNEEEVEYCVAEGDGLKEGNVDRANVFLIETKEKFDARKLHVSIRGPKQKPIKIDTEMLNSCLCKFSYWPRKVGFYTLIIQWEKRHIKGSPFDIWIAHQGTERSL